MAAQDSTLSTDQKPIGGWSCRTWALGVAATAILIGIAALYLAAVYMPQWQSARFLSQSGAAIEYRFGNVIGVSFGRFANPNERIPLSSDTLRRISALNELEHLDFSFTDLSDDDLASLEGLEQLKTLKVDCTCVTQNGLRNMQGFPELEVLSVLTSQIDPSAEGELRTRYPNLYIERLRLVDGQRIVEQE